MTFQEFNRLVVAPGISKFHARYEAVSVLDRGGTERVTANFAVQKFFGWLHIDISTVVTN